MHQVDRLSDFYAMTLLGLHCRDFPGGRHAPVIFHSCPTASDSLLWEYFSDPRGMAPGLSTGGFCSFGKLLLGPASSPTIPAKSCDFGTTSGGGDSLGRRKIYLCRAGNSPIVKNICVGCRSKEYKFGYEGGFTQFPLATNSNSCANVNLTTQLVLRFFYYYIRSLTGRLTALHPRI